MRLSAPTLPWNAADACSSGDFVRGRRWRSAGRHRAERRRQVEPAARASLVSCGSSAGVLRSKAAIRNCAIGEQAHYLGHADALKPALTAGENLAFWAGALGRDSRREVWAPALERLGSPMSKIFRCARCRRDRSGESRWRASTSRAGRSGCSTSRPLLWTQRRRSCLPKSCANTSPSAASSSLRPMRRSGSKGQTLRLGAAEAVRRPSRRRPFPCASWGVP